VRRWWPTIAVASWLGTVALAIWSNRGDRNGNFAQLAASVSLIVLSIFSIFSIFSVVTTLPKESKLFQLWQLWQKPPTIGRDELLEAIRQEVTDRSQQSLHYAVLNTLMFEKHPGEKIPRLWDVDLKIGQQPSRQLNPTENILDNFPDASHLGRVLMLGMQGSGKTSTLLEIAAELCDRARNNPKSPIPILLDLPNWQPNQPLPNWILSEIQAKYGVSIEHSQQWLEAGQLLLLLDGLDELDISGQQACVAALNELKLSDGRSQPMIVCTRMNCYKQVGKQLKFSAAIGLKSLNIKQIEDYLIGARSRELWENIKEDNQLLSLAKNPLLLNIMTLAHEEILIHAWKRITSKKDQVDYLFNAYVRSQLTRQMTSQWYAPGKEPTPEKTKHWLKWLAKTMTEQHYTEFSLDKLPYPPLDYAGHFISLGMVWILVIIYTGLFINFYTLNIGLTYAIFFIASAWGVVILLAWKTRKFKIKTYSPKILVFQD
jgi:hypothetical protein